MKQSRDYEKAMREATRRNRPWTDYLVLTRLSEGDDATAYRVPIIDGPLDEEWYEVIWPDGQRMRLHPYSFDADRDRWPPWAWTEVDEYDRAVGPLWSTRLTPTVRWGTPDRTGNPDASHDLARKVTIK